MTDGRVSWRRVFALVSVFLLLGVVANVAVAWSIAMWSPIEVVEVVDGPPGIDDQSWWERKRIAGTSERVLMVGRLSGLGADCRMMAVGLWNEAIRGNPYMVVHDIRTGLPMRSLDGSVLRADVTTGSLIPIFDSATQPMTFADVRRGAFELNRPAMLGGSSYRLIPYRPMWPGFAVNTIFYAILLWMVLVMPRALRRQLRIRRGQCPACAYPTGTSPLCTECGAAVSAMRVEA